MKQRRSMQCSVVFVLYQTACGDKSCFGYSSRRLLAGTSYGDLAAQFKPPMGWIPISTKVCCVCSVVCL